MEKYDEILNRFSDLLIKSEERIDRTNNMVEKCVLLIEHVTNEYVNHLRKLQESRDELLKQNGELIKLNEKYSDEIRSASKRYDMLLDKMLTTISNNKSENNINLK